MYTTTVVEELIAALRSLLIQLITVAVVIAIKISVSEKPSFPFNGEKATIANVPTRVKTDAIRSTAKSLGDNFQGCSGFATTAC
jgi:hypothetical protein